MLLDDYGLLIERGINMAVNRSYLSEAMHE